MQQFSKKSIRKEGIPESDLGVKVSDLLAIVMNNNLSTELFEMLNVDSIKDEFIEIPGAQTLVNVQASINNKYKKEDLESSLENIFLYNSNNEFSINFNNITNNEYLNSLGLTSIETEPIYSAKHDFFFDLFHMDKYAATLIDKGHQNILELNFKMIKDVCPITKRYRILHDQESQLFYLRALISLSNYYNYDNNVAVVVGLLALHDKMKKGDISYNLKLCEYNESFIRMFFESTEIKELESIGHVRNLIEISNDEIKREALRFSGVCSIIFEDNKKNEQELFIQNREVKSKILSVKHNQVPKTAISELADIENTKSIYDNLFEDIASIAKIKKPDQIKFMLKRKVEKAKNDDIKKIKDKILNELNTNTISNILQLLTLFKKIELLAGEDIEASEYLRYTISQVLIEKN